MVIKIDEEKFRTNFKNLDDAVLLGYEHVAALMSITVGATYQAAAKGKLPMPVIQSNKLVRWTVGQIRRCFNDLAALRSSQIEVPLALAVDDSLVKKTRIGRPRTNSDSFAEKGSRV